MPPKADPYATPLHRRIDAALLLLTIVIGAVFFLSSYAEKRAAQSHSNPVVRSVIR